MQQTERGKKRNDRGELSGQNAAAAEGEGVKEFGCVGGFLLGERRNTEQRRVHTAAQRVDCADFGAEEALECGDGKLVHAECRRKSAHRSESVRHIRHGFVDQREKEYASRRHRQHSYQPYDKAHPVQF